jgi:DNA-directed RNA polymerase specialized sigma24 family protein
VNEFGSNVERHRRELLVHCYRMLGSLPDAEDAVQETLLRGLAVSRQPEGRCDAAPMALPRGHERLPRCDCSR